MPPSSYDRDDPSPSMPRSVRTRPATVSASSSFSVQALEEASSHPRCQRPSPLPRRHMRCRRTTRSSQKAAANSTVHDDELAYKIACRRHKRSTEIEDSPAALKSRLRRSAQHVEVRVRPRPRHANQDEDLLIAQADQQPRHDSRYTKRRRLKTDDYHE